MSFCHAADTFCYYWLIDSYFEAGVAHADLQSSSMKKENSQGNISLPPFACLSVAVISRCSLLYHDYSPTKLLAGEIGPGRLRKSRAWQYWPSIPLRITNLMTFCKHVRVVISCLKSGANSVSMIKQIRVMCSGWDIVAHYKLQSLQKPWCASMPEWLWDIVAQLALLAP
jgi:hypothetical protein